MVIKEDKKTKRSRSSDIFEEFFILFKRPSDYQIRGFILVARGGRHLNAAFIKAFDRDEGNCGAGASAFPCQCCCHITEASGLNIGHINISTLGKM